jgi:hypothetical protein
MEVWMSNKPSLQHLCVFGCVAYVRVPKEKWSKLENKVMKCILINYEICVNWYEILDPVIGKVCIEGIPFL